jgi:hypothetical protein
VVEITWEKNNNVMGAGLLLAVSPLNDNWNSEDTQFQPENAPDKTGDFRVERWPIRNALDKMPRIMYS